METEQMDDFTVQGDLLTETLDQLARINKYLGGNQITMNGLKKILKGHPTDKPLTIVDMGCGNGDLLRCIAEYGKKVGYDFRLIGIDANAHTVAYARKLSGNYKELSFQQLDVFSEEFQKLEYDLVLATLFLHHFSEEEIVTLLQSVMKTATVGMVVNDLHRNALAYFLFRLLGLFIRNPMTREDGLISIRKAFKREDLENMSKNMNAKSSIQWKWAFRYQWIIKK
jgi:2-polyprenyl-3-methyl-5-hydroxy-6-metoxy-1,4-benzoquinol methylase